MKPRKNFLDLHATFFGLDTIIGKRSDLGGSVVAEHRHYYITGFLGAPVNMKKRFQPKQNLTTFLFTILRIKCKIGFRYFVWGLNFYGPEVL